MSRWTAGESFLPLSIRRVVAVHSVAAMALWSALCPGPSSTSEISRERAIEIARAEVSFEPASIDAVRAMSGARPIWRVTLRGQLPGQPPGLFETAIVEIDRRSGEVVSVART